MLKAVRILGVILLSAGSCLAAETPAATNDNSWSGTATNADGNVLATITVNTLETPDLADWGKRAGELCVEWYPKISELLASDGFEPPSRVRLRFAKDMDGVAATSGTTINISANYVRKATNDFGMVIHELVHVVQAYHHRGNPGWLVEGVADYVRLTKFEPAARRPRINPDRASYRDAYKTTAIFLEWAEKGSDKDLVPKLNRAMREGKFSMDLFTQYTGKTVDQLWQEFVESLRSKATAATSPPSRRENP